MSAKDKWVTALRNVTAGKKTGIRIVIGFALCFFLLFCMMIIGCFYGDYCREFEEKNRSQCYFFTDVRARSLPEMETELAEKRTWAEACGADVCAEMIALRPADGELVLMKDVSLLIDGTAETTKQYSLGRKVYYENLTSSMASLDIAMYTDRRDWCGNVTAEPIRGTWPDRKGELLLDDYLLSVFGIKPESIVGKRITIRVKNRDILTDYVVSGVVDRALLRNRESDEYTLSDYHIEHLYVHLRGEDCEGFVPCGGTIRYYFDTVRSFTDHFTFSGKPGDGTVVHSASGDVMLNLTDKGLTICLVTFFTAKFGRILLGLGTGICVLIMLSLFYVLWFYLQRNKRYMTMLECIGMERSERMGLRRRELAILGAGALAVALYLTLLFFLVFRYLVERVLQFRPEFHFGLLAAIVVAGTLIFRVMTDAVVRRYDEHVSI